MRRVVLATVSTVAGLVMLLTFKTHDATAAAGPVATGGGTTSGSTSGSGSGSSSGSGTGSTSGSGSGSTTGTKTATGDPADTQYGPVQVQVTVADGKITDVQAVEYPQNSPRDQQINAYAIPALNQEAVQAGNANIDMISGATFTSEGYIQSLQSALSRI
ncbi:MAG TPA: FMN-binding protein [Actinomycetes bacterium]|nr:FMN-binding protein [Actinomycetes bacterium]